MNERTKAMIVAASTLAVGGNIAAIATNPTTLAGAALHTTAIVAASIVLLLAYRNRRQAHVADGTRGSIKTVRAAEVRQGQTVVAITSYYRRPWRRRPIPQDQGVERTDGVFPSVVEAEFAEDGEGGHPTVYLMLSDDRAGHFCLGPDDEVTVEVTQS